MPFVTSFDLFEKANTGKISDSSTKEVRYILHGKNLDEEYVRAWVNDASAKLFEGESNEVAFDTAAPITPPIPNISGELELKSIDYAEVDDASIYLLTANYGSTTGGSGTPQNFDVGSYAISFDIATTKVKRKLSVATSATTPATAQDHENKVNVTIKKDGKENVEGYQLDVAVFRFTISYRTAKNTLTNATVKKIADHVNKVNNQTFLGYPAGTIRLLGAKGNASLDQSGTSFGDIKNDTKSDLSVVFEYRENADVNVPGVGVISVKGWELLWVQTAEKVEGDATLLKNIAAYAEQIYETADLNNIFAP